MKLIQRRVDPQVDLVDNTDSRCHRRPAVQVQSTPAIKSPTTKRDFVERIVKSEWKLHEY